VSSPAKTLTDTWLTGVHESWMPALEPVRPAIDRAAEAVLAARARGAHTLPADEAVFRALRTPLQSVRVLIVGQDPYPTRGNAVGLAFSVEPTAAIPASLKNIFRELRSDLGVSEPGNGDLSLWQQRGVLLLNRVLVVEEGAAGSLRKTGWEEVTAAIIDALVERGGALAAILWGNDAAVLGQALASVPRVVSVHPSPLSAHRGFFGSKPFSRANEMLEAQGDAPIDWSLEPGAPTLFDADLDS
jgi:uracil-DNA glycosylase